LCLAATLLPPKFKSRFHVAGASVRICTYRDYSCPGPSPGLFWATYREGDRWQTNNTSRNHRDRHGQCARRWAQAAFVICFINPDGAVLAVRTHPDRPVELLVNNGVDHCAGVQGVGVLLDKSGEKHTWTMRETKTEMTG